MPKLTNLDHLVLTVADIDRTLAFYRDILGMTPTQFRPADGSLRWSLGFGDQKINLHPAASPFDPKAAAPTPGSADLCFLSHASLTVWLAHFEENGVVVEEGPIARTGAVGPIMSLYIRDPDGNLIEVSNQT